MKFSLFYIPACQEGETYKHEFDLLIEQCEVADELGYDTVFLAEHHFSRVGMCPDALMVALAIAQRTKKIRIGTAICIMPFHNPVRLAEQAALVDVLSGGRLELGVGRGSQPKEFQGFNISPSESREKMQEGLEVMTRLLEGECLTFHGKHYSCIDAEIFPKPIQKPRPPIWLAGTSPRNLRLRRPEGVQHHGVGHLQGAGRVSRENGALSGNCTQPGRRPGCVSLPHGAPRPRVRRSQNTPGGKSNPPNHGISPTAAR